MKVAITLFYTGFNSQNLIPVSPYIGSTFPPSADVTNYQCTALSKCVVVPGKTKREVLVLGDHKTPRGVEDTPINGLYVFDVPGISKGRELTN